MLAPVRAALAAALLLLSVPPTHAADKAFQRNDLADAAIKLEAQIKADAGPVSKPAAALREHGLGQPGQGGAERAKGHARHSIAAGGFRRGGRPARRIKSPCAC